MLRYRIFNETETLNRTLGDLLPDLKIQIYDDSYDEAQDLTGYNLKWSALKSGETTAKIDSAVFSTGGVVSQGIFTYEFETTDVNLAGTFNCELELVNASSKVQTLQDRFTLTVRDSLN